MSIARYSWFLIFQLVWCCPAPVLGDQIYLLWATSHSSIGGAHSNLLALGHSVTSSQTVLSDYSNYDQVWDLRYATAITAQQRQTYADYLAGGGRMYFTGENATFDVRNNSVNSFLSQIGAGSVSFTSSTSGYEDQSITANGQVVNGPNTFSEITTYFGRRVSAPSSGFLVSESLTNPGTGSLIGWDFGDLPNHQNARMLVGYDIELFDNGVGWTENVATYLGASSIPEPSAAWVVLVAIPFVARRRNRK